jgi:hypothetical protein
VAEDVNGVGLGLGGSIWALDSYGEPYELAKSEANTNPEKICGRGGDYRGY